MTLPLAMNGRLSECLMLSYRTPARSVRHLVPRGLELETRGGYAFWNVLACRVEAVRPAGVPRRLGVTFNDVAYRLHVRAKTAAGETLRGLYFVRSDADSGLVARFGNALTAFRFSAADVELSRARVDGSDVLTLAVMGRREADEAADALVRVATDAPTGAAADLADGSPFNSPAEAADFLEYRPLGLSVDLDGRYLEMTEVVRDESAWREKPVSVIEAHWKFLDVLGQDELRLERATRVDAIDYRWRLGRRALLAQAVTTTPAPTQRRPAPAVRAAA
jgi:uncharacterized protein YqjF (DUF2071 family)